MKDKQEQIEEMVGILEASNNPFVDVPIEIMPNVAEALYNAGYRKVPEDSVVILREEYKKLKQYEEKVKNGACFTQKEWLELCDEEYKRETENLSKVRQLERKETAKEILSRINEYSLDYNYDLKKEFEKLCKDYGVEVEE